MAEDPQPMTLQQRIASLNAAHIGRVPGEPPLPRTKPQIPQKRPVAIRQQTVNNPPEQVHGSVTSNKVGNQPAGTGRQNGFLPPPPIIRDSVPVRADPAPRTPSRPPPPPLPKRQPSQVPPPLPARTESQNASRRGSEDSCNSGNGSGSAGSDGGRLTATRTKSNDRIKAPAWGEAELPSLPQRGASAAPRKYSSEQPKYVNRAPSVASLKSVASTQSREEIPPVPALPPRLPSRSSSSTQEPQEREQSIPPVPRVEPRFIAPIPTATTIEVAKRSALSFGLNKPEKAAIPPLSHSNDESIEFHAPPVPFSSRPDISAIQATKPRPATASSLHSHSASISTPKVCFVCRDFSGPDNHAALFPRQSVSSLPALAESLTSPFPSPTDKARAIFKWLHLNVRYDVDAFFANNIQPSTPASTLRTGLAVCEGFAGLFANLALHAGLDAIVVSGHGKGFGYAPLAPNSPLPPYNGNHAWNAVRIDGGEWKLIDPCWGAGHVQGANMPYQQVFSPDHFNMSNEAFGTKHFPSNKEHFFLPGGRSMTWEEYIVINPAAWPDNITEPATVFTNAKGDYGIGEKTVTPRERKINVRSNETVRFSFGLLCPHWTLAMTGKGQPPVFMLSIGGVDGRQKDQVPLEYIRGQTPGGGGDMWYVDIPARELGAPGMSLTLLAITRFGDRQDARGMSVREFREKKGKVAAAFVGVAAWDLV